MDPEADRYEPDGMEKFCRKVRRNSEMLEDMEVTEKEGLPVETETGEWIHDKEEDPEYVTGWKILPSCTCSKCGYHSNREKSVCPQCGSKMN